MPAIDPDDIPTNPSSDPHLREVAAAHPHRRTVLLGGASAAAAALFAVEPAAARGGGRTALAFAAIEPGTDDAVHVPAGYTATPFLPWGTPIVGAVPRVRPRPEHSRRAGPPDRHAPRRHALLPAARVERAARPAGAQPRVRRRAAPAARARRRRAARRRRGRRRWSRKSQAAHGVSRRGDPARRRRLGGRRGPGYNRRITASTPMAFTGPARGHRAAAHVRGPRRHRPARARSTTAPTASPRGAPT